MAGPSILCLPQVPVSIEMFVTERLGLPFLSAGENMHSRQAPGSRIASMAGSSRLSSSECRRRTR
jgi:hypothetical protein